MLRNRRADREASPMPFERYENIKNSLKNGEYAVIHQLPPQNALVQYRPQHRRLRNALIMGGLGAAAGAAYRFQQPLMKLGAQAYNYTRDKFHNLFQPADNTHPHIY